MVASAAAVAAAAVSIAAATAVTAAASSPYLLPGTSRLFVAAPVPSGSVGASDSLRYAALDPIRPLLGKVKLGLLRRLPVGPLLRILLLSSLLVD
jgi:hypothetical protein